MTENIILLSQNTPTMQRTVERRHLEKACFPYSFACGRRNCGKIAWEPRSLRFSALFERESPASSCACTPLVRGAERLTVRKTLPSFAFSGTAANTAPTASLAADRLPRLVDAWLDQGDIGGHSERTTECRRRFLDAFVWFVQRQEYIEVGKAEINAFLVYLRHGHKEKGGRFGKPRLTQPLSAGSIRTYYSAVAAFCNWCAAEGECLISPIHGVRAPLNPQDQVMPFSETEVEALQQYVLRRLHQAKQKEAERDLPKTERQVFPARSKKLPQNSRTRVHTVEVAERDVAMFYLLLDTGIRASELCSLKMGDIEMAGSRVTIRQGKGGKARVAHISKDTKRALAPLIRKNYSPDDYLFASLRGQTAGGNLSRENILQTVTEWCHGAGITSGKKGPHRFRHTFAVMFLRQGGSVFALKEILGHTSLSMTNRYVALANADIERQHAMYSPVAALRKGRTR